MLQVNHQHISTSVVDLSDVGTTTHEQLKVIQCHLRIIRRMVQTSATVTVYVCGIVTLFEQVFRYVGFDWSRTPHIRHQHIASEVV